MEIVLYRNNTYVNRVDKTNYLTLVVSIEGTLREDTSIIKPVIIFESDTLLKFNYVHIPIFNRYYFVDDVKVLSNKLYEVSLSVDVLTSYKDNILYTYAFIDRCSDATNSKIIDKKRVIESGYDITVEDVYNDIFYADGTAPVLGTSKNFVLTGFGLRTTGTDK